MARARISVLLTILILAGATACGSTPADVPEEPAGAETLSVDHVYGTTEINGVPQRVVTIDMPWTDTMLAMGVEPVGYSVDAFMPDETVPWQDLPDGAKPLDVAAGLPLEQIAQLDPDLILGTFSITDRATYDKLSKIAPTVPSLSSAEVTPWQDLVGLAGDILDLRAEAAELVDYVDADVLATADELPGLKGLTFSLAQYVVGDSMYVVADEEDGSSVFFQQLGMTMHGPVKEQGEKTGEARINIGTERADLLRADFLAFLVNGGDEGDLSDIPGFDDLPGTVAVLDYPTIVGLNTPSPLSIPYALEQLRPFLEAADREAESP